MVWLCLPTNRVDRPVSTYRPLYRWRPQRSNPAAKRAMGARKNRQAPRQMVHISVHRILDRRRVDHVFCRCTDIDGGFLDRASRTYRLCDGRRIDGNDIHLWRLHARTGVHLYVPLAAYPDGDDGRKIADRYLSGLARRTTGFGEKSRSTARCCWRLH